MCGRSKISIEIKQDVDAVAFLITDRARLSTLLIADDHVADGLCRLAIVNLILGDR